MSPTSHFSRLAFCGLLMLMSYGSPAAHAQDVYRIDNSHTSVIFAISQFNLSYIYGRVNQVDGEFQIDGGLANQFRFEIDAGSIDTNETERDKHLKGPDFFDVQQFPKITFQSKKISRAEGVYQVTGDMTILDKTIEMTIPIRLIGIGKGPFGKERAGFFAKFQLRRSDFGMDKMLSAVGDKIAVTFSFEGIKTVEAKD